jgi:hypothetical protein
MTRCSLLTFLFTCSSRLRLSTRPSTNPHRTFASDLASPAPSSDGRARRLVSLADTRHQPDHSLDLFLLSVTIVPLSRSCSSRPRPPSSPPTSSRRLKASRMELLQYIKALGEVWESSVTRPVVRKKQRKLSRTFLHSQTDLSRVQSHRLPSTDLTYHRRHHPYLL